MAKWLEVKSMFKGTKTSGMFDFQIKSTRKENSSVVVKHTTESDSSPKKYRAFDKAT